MQAPLTRLHPLDPSLTRGDACRMDERTSDPPGGDDAHAAVRRPADRCTARAGERSAGLRPIPGRRFQLLALGQSIFSALCIFFAGLALRNYFKLR
jgi:hypothetical protein